MRERRIAQRRRKGRIRLAIGVVLAATAATGSIALYRSSAFAVRRIQVEGVARLTERQVLDIARVPSGVTLLRFPAGAVKERLLREPWVADVSVTRDFPDGMLISVTERRPAALLDCGDTFWMLDGDGYVLERKALEETTTLVVVRDIEGVKPRVGTHISSRPLGNALRVLAGMSTGLRARVRAIRAPAVDETALLTNDGIEVLVGESADIGKKDVVTKRILQEQAGRVVFIDVRTVDRPVWRGLGD